MSVIPATEGGKRDERIEGNLGKSYHGSVSKTTGAWRCTPVIPANWKAQVQE
jgi:hypothetical protein